jgi:uroporphyrinogen decarboxylase
MNKRAVVRAVLDGKTPPYVPWSFWYTQEIQQMLSEHFDSDDLQSHLQNHLLGLGGASRYYETVGENLFKDVFGVVWDRAVDKDIGIVKDHPLKEPGLYNYELPDPNQLRFYEDIEACITAYPDCFRVFHIDFALYERAWMLRGMENLMMDFYDHPAFAHELLNTIADYQIALVKNALEYDIDAVYFGDDWGQQHGLQMGPACWREFLKPVLARMYAVVRDAGKYVIIHSCGDVDEVFDELVEIGINCFNPFQPEVMDVASLMKQYSGSLAFFGGLSTQKTLPYGTVQDVFNETNLLLRTARQGGLIFAPAHAIEGDVPLENIMAFLNVLFQQEEFDTLVQK